MVSLRDEGSLVLVVEDERGAARNRWRVEFQGVAAYRNILETYRLGLWARREELGGPTGWTWQVTHSDWLGRFRAEEQLVDVHAEGVRHYQLGTEDEVVEVLTPEVPTIEDLGPAGDAGDN